MPRSETIPLPSGGLFAEAVLGRYNAAEKLDLTRFWNWQDSPIPIAAPEIAPVQAGSRAQVEDLKPGQLSAPVLGIQAPTALPDAAGITAIINAVQNGNMFRDMSGLAQTAALAQATLQASAQGATAAGEQAGQTLATVMANNTERMRIAAAVATGGASALAGDGGGSGSRPAKNITEEGARINQARDMDERGVGGAGRAAAARGASAADTGDTMDLPDGASGSAGTQSPNTEGALFDRTTGAPGASAFEKALAFGGIDAELATGKKRGGASGKSSTPQKGAKSHRVFVMVIFELDDPDDPDQSPYRQGEVSVEITDETGALLYSSAENGGPDGWIDLRPLNSDSRIRKLFPHLAAKHLAVKVKIRHHDFRDPDLPSEANAVIERFDLPNKNAFVTVYCRLEAVKFIDTISSSPGQHQADAERWMKTNGDVRPWTLRKELEELPQDKLKVSLVMLSRTPETRHEIADLIL